MAYGSIMGQNTMPALKAHINDTNNPHQVSTQQIGAATAVELNAHVQNRNNPHQVTAAQVGALSTQGGFINGDLTISNNLVTNSGNIISNNSITNFAGRNTINFQSTLLTHNGKPIEAARQIDINSFTITNQETEKVIGQYHEVPYFIVVYMGDNGKYQNFDARLSLAIGSIYSLQYLGRPTDCKGRYYFVDVLGQVTGGDGSIGFIDYKEDIDRYEIKCTKQSFLGHMFFSGYGTNKFTTCAYFL